MQQKKKAIDDDLEIQISKETIKWRQILFRILDCIKFLASQKLALRGHFEALSNAPEVNVGNFLSLLKLLGKYDLILQQHLQHAVDNRRCISYLSPQIQN